MRIAFILASSFVAVVWVFTALSRSVIAESLRFTTFSRVFTEAPCFFSAPVRSACAAVRPTVGFKRASTADPFGPAEDLAGLSVAYGPALSPDALRLYVGADSRLMVSTRASEADAFGAASPLAFDFVVAASPFVGPSCGSLYFSATTDAGTPATYRLYQSRFGQ